MPAILAEIEASVCSKHFTEQLRTCIPLALAEFCKGPLFVVRLCQHLPILSSNTCKPFPKCLVVLQGLVRLYQLSLLMSSC